jgi:hypothetical protein
MENSSTGCAGSCWRLLDANESQVLNRIAVQVDQGLEVGWSVIQHNGELQRELKPALAIRGEPAQEGQQTRSENERREEAVRAEVEAKLNAPRGDGAPAGTTTTITTHAAPAVPPQSSQGRVAVGTGSTKKGQ